MSDACGGRIPSATTVQTSADHTSQPEEAAENGAFCPHFRSDTVAAKACSPGHPKQAVRRLAQGRSRAYDGPAIPEHVVVRAWPNLRETRCRRYRLGGT